MTVSEREDIRRFFKTNEDVDVAKYRSWPEYWREVDDCEKCKRAAEGASFWDRVEDTCGIKVGCYRRSIDWNWVNRRAANKRHLWELLNQFGGHGSNPWVGTEPMELEESWPRGAGGRVLPRADVTAGALTRFFEAAGGKADFRIKNDPQAEPKPPFGKFIYLIWDHLPSDPVIRLQTPRALIRGAHRVFQLRRNPQHGFLKPDVSENIHLEVTAQVEVGGRMPGEVFSEPASKGKIWDLYWSKRLKDGSVVRVGPDGDND